MIHIIEPYASGHHMEYVRRLISEILGVNKSVILSTFPSSISNPTFQSIVDKYGGRVIIQYMNGEEELKERIQKAGPFKTQFEFWKLFKRHIKFQHSDAHGNQIIVPYLDYCSYIIGLLGSPFGVTPYQGIVMRPDFHWEEMGVVAPISRIQFIKKRLFLQLLKNKFLTELTTIDPSLYDWLQIKKPISYQKVKYMEDPSDMRGVGGRHQARQYFHISEEHKVILLFGAISLRKGVRKLFELLNSSDYVVLMVGKQSDEVMRLVEGSKFGPGRLIVCNRFVTAQEEWLAFNAADFVWVAYDNFYGPSGVLAQAKQLRLNVIHSGVGLIGYQLRTTPSMNISNGLVLSNLEASI